MGQSNESLIKKLQSAINSNFDAKLLYNKQQFYSNDAKRAITMFVIKQAVWDEKKQRVRSIELFSSTSQIQIVLFLRDYWYECNGWAVPTDNEYWNECKAKYYGKQKSKEEETNGNK